MAEWKYGSEVFAVEPVNDDTTAGWNAPVVWMAKKSGYAGLIGYGGRPEDAIADWKRTHRDRAFAARDGMCSG